MHRHQFHRGHAEIGQMPDGFLGPQPHVGSAEELWNLRMQFGEALHVRFVDHCLVPGSLGRPVASPGEGSVDHRAERRESRVIAGVERKVGMRVADLVTIHFVAPADAASHGLGIRIQHHLVGIKAMALVRRVGPMYAVSVQLLRQDGGKIAVPDLIGLLGQRDADDLRLVLRRIEQAQFHVGRMFRKDCEIDAGTVPRGSQRIRIAVTNFQRFAPGLQIVVEVLLRADSLAQPQNMRRAACGIQFHKVSRSLPDISAIGDQVMRLKRLIRGDSQGTPDQASPSRTACGTDPGSPPSRPRSTGRRWPCCSR